MPAAYTDTNFMLIDKNGLIDIQNLGLIITPKFTVDDIKSVLNLHSEDIKFRGSNSGYERYGIKDMLLDGLPFGGLFIFYNSQIAFITMSYRGYTSKIKTYEEITPELRELTREKHEKLLIEQHGATNVKYSWGKIGLGIDTKVNGDSSIIITYNNFPIKGRE